MSNTVAKEDRKEAGEDTALSSSSPHNPKRCWAKTALVGVAVLFGVGVVFHSTWLPWSAIPLARFDLPASISPTDSSLPKNIVITRAVWKTLPTYEFATAFAQADSDRKILVLPGYDYPTEKLGGTLTFGNDVLLRLRDRGVSELQLSPLDNHSAFTDEDKFRELAVWLDANPKETVLVPTKRFGGAVYSAAADRVLTVQQRRRVFVIGFPCKGVDESNWWKSQVGIKSLLGEGLWFGHYKLFGDQPLRDHWDPDEFEQELIRANSNHARHRGSTATQMNGIEPTAASAELMEVGS